MRKPKDPSSLYSVPLSVAESAKCNEVVRRIAAELTSRLQMMHLQIVHGAAFLASPTISFQHLVSYQSVLIQFQFNPWLLLP
jgi:hypothetical protein